MPERRLDNTPDVRLISLPRRQIPVGDLGVLIHELGHSRVRLRLTPAAACSSSFPSSICAARSVLQVFRQPDLAARQRIGPSVDLHPPRPARQLLYVSGRPLTHDITVTRTTDTRSTSRSTRTMIKMVFSWWGARGSNPEPMG